MLERFPVDMVTERLGFTSRTITRLLEIFASFANSGSLSLKEFEKLIMYHFNCDENNQIFELYSLFDTNNGSQSEFGKLLVFVFALFFVN